MEQLFVYGTLMPGWSQYRLLEPFVDGHAPGYVDRGWLFALPQGYPALVLPGADGTWPGEGGPPPWGPARVHGVVCTLRAMAPGAWQRLDAYEDCDPHDPHCLYERRQHPVATTEKAGARGSAWVYAWNPRRLAELRRVGRPLASGRFSDERRRP